MGKTLPMLFCNDLHNILKSKNKKIKKKARQGAERYFAQVIFRSDFILIEKQTIEK